MRTRITFWLISEKPEIFSTQPKRIGRKVDVIDKATSSVCVLINVLAEGERNDTPLAHEHRQTR